MYSKVFPENQTVLKAIEVCSGKLSTLTYLEQEYNKKIIKFPAHEEDSEVARKAIADTKDMAHFVEEKRKGLYSKLHNGTISADQIDILRPDHFNFQDLLAHKKLDQISKDLLTDKFNNIVMIYDINSNSEFARGYMSNGKYLDPNVQHDQEIIGVLDQTFHSWLVSNGMVSQDGVIYNKDKLDKNGNFNEKAEPGVVTNLIVSSEKGLDAALKKQDKDLSISVKRNQPQSNPEPSASSIKDSNL